MTLEEETIQVLHVDDDPSFVKLAATFLQQEDDRMSVDTALTATDGLRLITETDVDCIVSDYDMPELSGIKFLETVREQHPDLPFILFTGKGSEEVASEAISAGVTDYLQKESGTDQYTVLANRIRNAVSRRRAERAAENTRQQLEAVVDRLDTIISNIPIVLFSFDSDGIFTLYEGKGLDKLEADPGEVVGESVFDVYQGREETLEAIEMALSGETSTTVRDLGHAVFEVTYQPVLNESGSVDVVIGVAIDITDLKERERELERQNERLDEFTSVISHDLRNPLSIAEAGLGFVAEECESDHLAEVKQAHDRMRTLIDDLLTLARNGEAVADTEPVELTQVLRDCRGAIETDKSTFVADIDQTIQANESRLKQVFENLFRNAVEHGGDEVTVTVGQLSDGFYIEDNGPGIQADDREAVFDPGYSTSSDGTGFGLSIVKEIVAAHGWEIDITDGEQDGARFEISGVEFVSSE